jgi:formate/nitrite transporter
MPFKTPPEIAAAAVAGGVAKSRLSWDKALVAGFLAGAYIALAGLLAIVVSAGLNPATWGGVQTLLTGAVFSMGLVLVVVAGSELLTGNMALLPLGFLARRVTFRHLVRNFGFVLIGNLLGSVFVAYVLAVKTGVLGAPAPLARLGTIATGKAVTETDTQIFLRAIGCNWLVCLAVWTALAADDVGGKILAIFLPITGFVALGFDHVVANMFFLPAAIFEHVQGVNWGNTAKNLVLAFLGNFVGAAVFVAGAYWHLYVRGAPEDVAGDRGAVEGNGQHREAPPAPSRRAA